MLWERLVLAAIAVVGVAVFFLLLWHRGIRYKPAVTQDNPYRAVSIRFRSNACEAVKRLAGKRFLTPEVPPLPLPRCRCERCECRYLHHADRRRGEDRRSGLPSPFTVWNAERRVGRGRRSSDKVA
jgi:hypothetical protein